MVIPRNPLISVVIPTYHRNDLLAKCLSCLAPDRQTLDNQLYEVIVSDDGRDSTAETLIAENFPWAKWVSGPKKGPASNRNNGAAHSDGAWIAFTDDDCLPSDSWLETFSSAASNDRNALEGRTTCAEGIKSLFQHSPVNENGGSFWSCNIMVRRTFFESLQGFDESFPCPHMEDVDFRERIYGTGETIHFVPEAVIDHPPRPAYFGKRLAAMQETEFLFYYKSGHSKPYLIQHLRRMVSLRLQLLRKRPISSESVAVLFYLLPELFYVARHGNHWQDKYKKLYSDAHFAYPPDLVSRTCQW